MAKLTAGKALPPEVLDQILAHTDGVPLFIEELTKSVLESKLLREAGDRYVLEAPLPALAIPTTLARLADRAAGSTGTGSRGGPDRCLHRARVLLRAAGCGLAAQGRAAR